MPKYSLISRLFVVPISVVAGLLMAACGPTEIGRAEIEVKDAWLRPPMISGAAGRPAAGYMIIVNSGGRGDKLLGATYQGGEQGTARITLHRSFRQDGIARMTALDEVPIPARNEVEFRPGGTHLMIFGLDDETLQGGAIELILQFELSGDLAVTFGVGEEER